eukprot:CAMPEP_0194129120 /NCGR_PEP_ID=MMETSP0152-20130528/346_1 /TAXON_ID=1049557 /ORGANISM="Thalassiothrix antarctica, Strain L6-D1" /LENGTH=340 /DNA_ID=CAMNT_0038823209 /DNA_START=42 /DNA_END=1061 /DNA_ORIENTATION=-
MMKNYCFLFLSAIACCCLFPVANGKIIQHRGSFLEEKSGALVQRKLPSECDYYGGKKGSGGTGKKGGESCEIPSCCECDCHYNNDNDGGGRGQVCDCVCDCGDDDDDDDDDDDEPHPPPPPTPSPTRQPTPSPTRHPTSHPTSLPKCDVCGNGRSVNNPFAVVEVSGIGTMTCERLQEDGRNRQISARDCRHIPDQIDAVCGCNPPCNICGNGKPVGKPNAIVRVPGLSHVRCGELQDYGLAGSITPSECRDIPEFISNACQCNPTPNPTRNPTRNPTPSPTRSPICIPVGKKGGKGGKKGGNGCAPSGGGKKGGYRSGDGLVYGGKKAGYRSGDGLVYS